MFRLKFKQRLGHKPMSISNSITRFVTYYDHHGLKASIRRVALALKRELFSKRMVLFYCELSRDSLLLADFQSSLKVERRRNTAEINPQEMQEMINSWNPKLIRRNMTERFGKGASLWMLKSESRLAGFGWTIRGRTIEPHYFPLGQDDVHLFDFYIFPRHRGRGMNPYLVTQILCYLAAENVKRAFIEAADWNHSQLTSLKKTPFLNLGWARKFTVFGLTIVCWVANKNPQQVVSNRGQRIQY